MVVVLCGGVNAAVKARAWCCKRLYDIRTSRRQTWNNRKRNPNCNRLCPCTQVYIWHDVSPCRKNSSLNGQFEHSRSGFSLQSIQPRRSPQISKSFWMALHPKTRKLAEIEIGVMCRQALSKPLPDMESFKSQVKAWTFNRNIECSKISWQFTTKDARIKLKRLYPVLIWMFEGWDTRVGWRTKGTGCPYCKGRRPMRTRLVHCQY